MKALDDLLETLKRNPDIKAYKALETSIEANPEYKRLYTDVIEKQKAMIQKRTAKAPDYNAAKKAYDDALQRLTNSPVVEQYLSLQEDINEEVQMLFTMIETALNADLSDD